MSAPTPRTLNSEERQEVVNTLLRDGYFARFNKHDAIARKCQDSECFERYIDSLHHPTKNEYIILEKAVSKASSLLDRYTRLHNIPWRFLTTADDIESGFPHTHGEFIIIPRSHIFATITDKAMTHLIDTLVHEKIHVYQRLYPCQSNILYLDFWKLQIVQHTPHSRTNHRTNPDTNMLTYSIDGTIIASEYINPIAPLLHKTKGDFDHPHEIMAYVATHIITNGSSHLDIKMKTFTKSTSKWLDIYG